MFFLDPAGNALEFKAFAVREVTEPLLEASFSFTISF